jgi:hypothetical protein
LDEQLSKLAQENSNFHYEKSTLENSADSQHVPIDQKLTAVLSKVTKPRLYVCGPEETANKLKTKGFLSGVASSDIYSDIFK